MAAIAAVLLPFAAYAIHQGLLRTVVHRIDGRID